MKRTLIQVALILFPSLFVPILVACSSGLSRPANIVPGQTIKRITQIAPASVPLRVNSSNPRYFTDGYCLANPGIEYLVYLPTGERWGGGLFRRWYKENVTVDLSTTSGVLSVGWLCFCRRL